MFVGMTGCPHGVVMGECKECRLENAGSEAPLLGADKPFIPSSWMLGKMIESAEAKFAASRERALRERAERAFAHNARVTRECREHNCRRYINAGDRP